MCLVCLVGQTIKDYRAFSFMGLLEKMYISKVDLNYKHGII